MGILEKQIYQKLVQKFAPTHIELENESHSHSVPQNSETHFKLILVSQAFEGLSRVKRQQLVYSLLNEEFQSGLHALAQRSYTPQEWSALGESVEAPSPVCNSKK